MVRRVLSTTVPLMSLLVMVTACGNDDGAGVRESAGPGSSGSVSGSVSESGSGSEPAAADGVPAGVARQYATLEEEIRTEGGETRSGSWRVAYVVEPAEPWFERRGSDYAFRRPARGETHHIEIIPFEAATGRVVPDVPIRLEVLGAGGKVVDAKRLNFYYAEFFHYANNFAVPEAGSYTLRATLSPPTFPRHGEEDEKAALTDGATVTFQNVRLQPGR